MLSIKLGIALVAVLISGTGPARADVQYDTSGEDTYSIDFAGAVSKVIYAGTQRLSIRRDGGSWRFEARAQYVRNGPSGRSAVKAFFVQVLRPDGSFEDRADDDPDFLTVLNQPFAVQLDAATLRDVRTMRGKVPFSATSPLGAEAVLRGFLRPALGGPIDGTPTVAVRFEADGTMTGPLAGNSQTLLAGTMRMDGIAYYAIADATLMALNVTLTLNARLVQGRASPSLPVRIIYHRSMRAVAKTPLRAPLGAGAEMAVPAVR